MRQRTMFFISIISFLLLTSFSGCGTATSTTSAPPSTGVTPPSSTTPSPVVTIVPSPGTHGVTITMSDNGKSVSLKKGDTLLVVLDNVTYDQWKLTVADADILVALSGKDVPPGAQGRYQANKSGQTTLTAAGEPKCRKANPPCQIYTQDFHVQVTVS